MGKTKTTIINRFDGGISEDRRVDQSNKFAVTKHFDAFTYKHKLVPYMEAVVMEGASSNIRKFAIAEYDGSYRVMGLGDYNDTVTIFYRGYDGTLYRLSPSSTIDYDLLNGYILFPYKDKLYTFADNRLINFTPGGSWDNTGEDLTSITNVAEPVRHPNDDIAYFFYDNIVGKIDGANAFEDNKLVLPSNMYITSACPYGNYLAIACTTLDTLNPKSIVFLWDRDSSLTTISERIDFGEGTIKKLANLAGNLTAVMDFYLTSTYGLDKGKILIKQANGQFAVTVNEIVSDNALAKGVMGNGIVSDNILYQSMVIERYGDYRKGIWAIDSNGNTTLDYVDENVADDGTEEYNAILKTGNVWYIAYGGTSSRCELNKTKAISGDDYGFTSTYESLIFDSGDLTKTKKLIGITVETEALPSILGAVGQVVLKYRKDEDLDDATAWTTILTHSGEDEIRSSAINISGATLPQHKEIQFRLESKNGAVITGLKFKTEFIEDDIY